MVSSVSFAPRYQPSAIEWLHDQLAMYTLFNGRVTGFTALSSANSVFDAWFAKVSQAEQWFSPKQQSIYVYVDLSASALHVTPYGLKSLRSMLNFFPDVAVCAVIVVSRATLITGQLFALTAAVLRPDYQQKMFIAQADALNWMGNALHPQPETPLISKELAVR